DAEGRTAHSRSVGAPARQIGGIGLLWNRVRRQAGDPARDWPGGVASREDRAEVHVSAKDFPEAALQGRQTKQVHAGRRIEFGSEVDVAGDCGVTPGSGSE